jgi:uncharacterized protein YbbC (DUF1343 family)
VVTDRKALKPVTMGVALATTLRRLYGEKFDVDKMAGLLKKASVLDAIRQAKPIGEIVPLWEADECEFAARRANYLLYGTAAPCRTP